MIADNPVQGASATQPPPPSVPPAQVDEYEIIRSLGRGAMGQVYLAKDSLLGRPVAVKFIAQDNPSDAARERFLIEARAIARLQHPNVLAIYRVGLIAGQPYLVSEFVRGQSLDQLTLPLPWQRALDIAIQLARGLGAAHRQGVLHRDIKPSEVAGCPARRQSGPEAAADTLRMAPFLAGGLRGVPDPATRRSTLASERAASPIADQS